MFFGLDAYTMKSLAITAASLAALAFVYFSTKRGMPALDLNQNDLQLIALGAVKGALHTDNIDNILDCVKSPLGTFDEIEHEIEDAVLAFSQNNIGISDIIVGVNALGKSFKKLGQAVD